MIVLALTMLLFGLLSREMLMRWRDRMMELGKGLKAAQGLILVATGQTIAIGLDKAAFTDAYLLMLRRIGRPP